MNSRGMMNGCTQAPGGSGSSGGPNGMYMNGMQPYMYDPSGMDQSQMSMPFTHYGSMMGGSGLASMDGSGYGHHFFGGMAQQQQQQQMLLQQQHQNMAASVYGGMGGSFSMPGSDQMSMASHYQSGVGMGHYLNGGSSSYAHYPQQQQQQIPPSVRPTPTPQPNPQEIADSIYHMASSAYRAPVPPSLAPPGSRSAQHQAQLPPQTQSQQQQSQQPLQQTSHHQQQQAHSLPAAPMTPLGGGGHAPSNGGSAAVAGVSNMVSMPGCYSPGPPYGRSSGMLSPAMGVTQQPRAAGAPGSSSSSSSHPSPTAAGGASGPMSPLSIRSPPLSAVPSVHSAGGGGGNLAGQLSPGSVQSANSPGLTPPPHVLAQSHLHRSSPSSSHLLALHGASPSSSSGMAAAAGSMYSQGVVRSQHAAMSRMHAQQMGAPGQMAGSDSGVMVPSGMFGNPLQSLERLAQITDKYPVDPKSIVSGNSMHDAMSLYHHQSPMAQQQLPVHLQQQQQQSSAAHSYALYGMQQQQQQPGAGSHYQTAIGSGYATAMTPHLQPAGDYAKLEPAERSKTSTSQGKKSGNSKTSSHAASSSGSKGKSAGAGKKPGAAGKTAVQSPQASEDGLSRKVADESGSGGDGMGVAGHPAGLSSNSFQPSSLGVASSTAGGDSRTRTVHATTDAANTGVAATTSTEATNSAGAHNNGSPAECTLHSLLSVPPGRSPPHYPLHQQKKPTDVGGSAAGPTAASPKAGVIASPASAADEAHLGLGVIASAAVQALSSIRDKEDGLQKILSPMRPPQSPAMADLASAASAGSGSSADSVGSGLREDRCALEAEADGMLLSHETCAPADSPVVGDANDCRKASGSSVRGGDESCRVDASHSHDSEHAELTAAASAARDSSDCAKPLQHSANARREEPRGGAAVAATAPLDPADRTGTSDAAMAAAKRRSASSSMPTDPLSAGASGSSAVASSLHTSVSAAGASAAAPPVAVGLAAGVRGTLLTGILGAAPAAPTASAAVTAASATAAGIDYSNSKNVPLRKRKPGLPPSAADASTRSCGPLVVPSSLVLPTLLPPLLQQRDPAAPVAKKPRALGLLKKPPPFAIVASDGGSGSGRSTVTLSPSVLAAAAAAHRTPEKGEPAPPHLEKAVTTPVKAEHPERKDSRASVGLFPAALPPSPGSATADTLKTDTTSPPLREQPQQRRRRSSSSDASPAVALTSQRRPAAVAALSLLAAESRSSGSVVASAKSDVAPCAPLSGLRSLMAGSSVLPAKSSAALPSSIEATGGSVPMGSRNSGGTSAATTAMLQPSADGSPVVQPEVVKRKRGRPLGSKNKKKDGLSYKPTKKERAKSGTTSKRSAAAVAAAAIASLEGTGRAGRTSSTVAAGHAVPASHSAIAGQQTPKSAPVAAAGSAVVDCGKPGTPSQCLVVGGVKVEVVAAASPLTSMPAAAVGSVARTAVADAAADRLEVRVASFTKVGRVKEMSPRGQQIQQPQQHLTAVPLNVSARSLAAADDSPWQCVFCHEVSNFKSLGDLFGPYRIVGASPCSPGPTNPGQFCQPLRPASSVATPAAADAVEPVKRGRPPSAAKASSSTSTAAARRSTTGATSPSAAAGSEWRLATEGGGGRLRTVWYHEDCAVWAPGVNLVGQQLVGLDEAVAVGEQSFCTRCKRNGALLGCYWKGCSNKYHYYCAIEDGCTLTEENFSTVCPRHSARGPTTSNAAGVAQAGAVTKGAATAEASHTSSETSGTPKKKPRY